MSISVSICMALMVSTVRQGGIVGSDLIGKSVYSVFGEEVIYDYFEQRLAQLCRLSSYLDPVGLSVIMQVFCLLLFGVWSPSLLWSC